MTLQKGYLNELQALTGDVVLGYAALELLDSIMGRVSQHTNVPLRLYASATPDAFLNIGPSVTTAGDGSKKQVPPINSAGVPSFVLSTINFATGATTGSSITLNGVAFATGFAALTKTNGQFRRFAFALQADGSVSSAASAQAASQAALSDYGALLAGLGGLPSGYIDVVYVTAATAYKTANSATNVIENADIYRLPLGGGSSGSSTSSTGFANTTSTTASFTVPVNTTTFWPGNMNILTGHVVTDDGTLVVEGIISGPGLLAGAGTVRSVTYYRPALVGTDLPVNTNLDDITATRLGLKQYLFSQLSGTQGTPSYNGGNSPTIQFASVGSGQNNVTRAVFMPYQASDGTWRMRFTAHMVPTSGTAIGTNTDLTLGGVTFKTFRDANNQGTQFVGFNTDSAAFNAVGARAVSNTGTISVTFSSSNNFNGSSYQLFGDVELEAKPTWAY